MGVPPKFRFFIIFYSQNALLAKNQNGPYGPYEQLLKDGKGNYWGKSNLGRKSKILERSQILKNQFWSPKQGL